jgi:hypothetical protein
MGLVLTPHGSIYRLDRDSSRPTLNSNMCISARVKIIPFKHLNKAYENNPWENKLNGHVEHAGTRIKDTAC